MSQGHTRRVVALVRTCSAAPVQWSGLLCSGEFVYVRFRHGTLTVRVGYTSDDLYRNPALIEQDRDDEINLDYAELVEACRGKIEFPPEEQVRCHGGHIGWTRA